MTRKEATAAACNYDACTAGLLELQLLQHVQDLLAVLVVARQVKVCGVGEVLCQACWPDGGHRKRQLLDVGINDAPPGCADPPYGLQAVAGLLRREVRPVCEQHGHNPPEQLRRQAVPPAVHTENQTHPAKMSSSSSSMWQRGVLQCAADLLLCLCATGPGPLAAALRPDRSCRGVQCAPPRPQECSRESTGQDEVGTSMRPDA